ncbi:MAG: ATP-binding protein [Calditrichia bacterium]
MIEENIKFARENGFDAIMEESDNSEWKEIYRLSIPSSPIYIEKIIIYFLGKLSAVKSTSKHLFAIRTCLSEILANAMEHGNHFDLHKKVKISLQIEKHRLRITVTDEGEGFDFRNFRTNLKKINREFQKRGRGIFIVKKYMDSVKYSSPGNSVTMIKYLDQ